MQFFHSYNLFEVYMLNYSPHCTGMRSVPAHKNAVYASDLE